ncbi:hypothetical protein DdX_05049 [Ditylenchus destructor]|uniref:Uncharacterized protein n=1 Tax=Ditylenchus destructor TaxID=166010 RepID=A0AAD4NB22_9BILA|nr:hypothetical protein DdX_05049 [Ditylenchus destructor]
MRSKMSYHTAKIIERTNRSGRYTIIILYERSGGASRPSLHSEVGACTAGDWVRHRFAHRHQYALVYIRYLHNFLIQERVGDKNDDDDFIEQPHDEEIALVEEDQPNAPHRFQFIHQEFRVLNGL